MCGATVRIGSLTERTRGLSPRVRGNPARHLAQGQAAGPIPACAGQPSQCVTVLERARAYPRVCGATSCTLTASRRSGGLSPRVRGNPMEEQQPAQSHGPIPACAGQPETGERIEAEPGAYPRVCGATGPMLLLKCAQRGLSPRVRGNLPAACRVGAFLGPIPACAGQPMAHGLRVNVFGAYPRVCGATDSMFALRACR